MCAVCYSAQVEADYRKYISRYGADISLAEFHHLYWERDKGAKVKVPKALDVAFQRGTTDEERAIADMIARHDAQRVTMLEQDLFKQKKRLADAERALQVKMTKKAQDDRRIATGKIEWTLGKLAEIRRTTLIGEDSRIFPGWYAPVLIAESGRKVVKPMRYQCRPAGKPAFYDVKFPGTYNARRDNLEGFWRGLFGVSHGVMSATAFFENVSRHTMEHRELAPGEKEENVILEFRPRPVQDMLIACLWSHWKQGDEELWSFAAITDDPPPEVAAAGHDRCVIPIKPEHLDAWLSPDPRNLAAVYTILDDRERPYYEHRMAA